MEVNHEVVARKYRPATFHELTGQEHVSKTLQNSLDRGRLHHAYLFSGVRGTGKTTTARILARGANCIPGITSQPCLKCSSCIEISIGNALDVIEIVAATRFYDFEAKYAPGGSKHLLPAPILPFVYQEVRRLTLKAHQALGCRGVTRADFRYDDQAAGTEGLVCLEVNTQPGMTETSLVPELAIHAGLTFDELVRWMVEDASLNR